MNKIAVLGSGLVGRTIAIDLERSGYDVTSFDLDKENLDLLKNKSLDIHTKSRNLLTMNYIDELSEYDFVVSAVPGSIGFNVLLNIIKAKKNCVDISFFKEDYRELFHLAMVNNVTVMIDCGIAPGMSNMILGRENKNMEVDNYVFYVGGLPKVRTYPFEYKAPYSPTDVIEFYVRPCRERVNGKDITKLPMSEIENIEIENLGTLEAFNTDGLRSLLTSFPNIPNMSEKTLRYVGYASKINLLKDMGFFKPENLKFTSDVLINQWKMTENDKDITVMVSDVYGKKGNKKFKTSYYIIDEHDGEFSSMSRVTAFTATSVVDLIMKNMFNEVGVFPPEYLSESEINFEHILEHLRERNVFWNKKTTEL